MSIPQRVIAMRQHVAPAGLGYPFGCPFYKHVVPPGLDVVWERQRNLANRGTGYGLLFFPAAAISSGFSTRAYKLKSRILPFT